MSGLDRTTEKLDYYVFIVGTTWCIKDYYTFYIISISLLVNNLPFKNLSSFIYFTWREYRIRMFGHWILQMGFLMQPLLSFAAFTVNLPKWLKSYSPMSGWHHNHKLIFLQNKDIYHTVPNDTHHLFRNKCIKSHVRCPK